ncbi:hypothetical protein, partial [Oceaniglobus trochenteri]|uniref:hypothetical protein n=1 Tax=Oceaniglobus trochenteri TaxID=2763260 RepID=UPI001D000DB0
MLVSENTTFTLQLAAGTHTPATRQTLDDLEWSFGSNQLKILGADVSGGEPTTIIDGASLPNGWWTKYSEIARAVNFVVEDIKFTGFSTRVFTLRYGGGRWSSRNLWSTSAGGLLELRGFHCEVRGSDAATPSEITGYTSGAIVIIDCYYEIGDGSDLSESGVIEFDGTGTSISISRRSVGYVRSCVGKAASTHIELSRLARCRTQNNSFAGWTYAAIWRQDASAIWNNDESNLDTIDAASLTTATPFLRTGGVGETPWSAGSTWEPHAQLHGCTVSIASNSSETDRDITEIATGGLEALGPRLPEFFWFSNNAGVRLSYLVTVSDGNAVTLRVRTGDQLVASIVIPSGSGSRDFCVQFDIRSGSADAAAGSFSALAFGDGSVVA